MLRISLYVAFIVFLIVNSAKAQKVDTMGELSSAYTALKGVKSMGYNYDSDVSFPNGNRDRIKGRMYINYNEKFIYNDCDAYTMLYTNHLFYKADHRQKTIMFVNTEKNYDKKLRKKTEEDIFEGGAIEKFADTSMLRKAIVKEMKISNEGILTVELSFPAGNSIKRLDLQYDKFKKTPLSYSVEIFQPTAGANKGVIVKIKCTKFSSKREQSGLSCDEYFTYNKGKLELKKYNTYKINTNTTQK